jgi:mannonate dehydratase
MIVTPFCGENLQLAAQVGVEEIVAVYPGAGLEPLLKVKRKVEKHGMRLTHIERKLPHEQIVHGLPGRNGQVEMIKNLIRDMAEGGLEVLCYNWMPSEDWCRTTSLNPERGGSYSTAFNVNDAREDVTDADGPPQEATSASRLWKNLENFLDEVLPVAEDAGIKLAIHPDDPPLKNFWGQEQILCSIDALERVTQLAPSPSNGICLCTGSLGPAGEDLTAGIGRLADRIHFVHLRNTRGHADNFKETWPDNGASDLPAAMRALHDIGYRGTIRPDHAPSMLGESNATPGYEMKGRLFAAGYLRGLMQACREKKKYDGNPA